MGDYSPSAARLQERYFSESKMTQDSTFEQLNASLDNYFRVLNSGLCCISINRDSLSSHVVKTTAMFLFS